MEHTLNIQFHKSKKDTLQAAPSSNPSYAKVLITKYRARKEAGRVVKALKEVKDFESGKKTPKSFEDFLSEL